MHLNNTQQSADVDLLVHVVDVKRPVLPWKDGYRFGEWLGNARNSDGEAVYNRQT